MARKADLTVDRDLLDQFKQSYDGGYPHHIAVIMDGNGRWAERRGKERVFGHEAGARAVNRIVESCRYLKIKILTLYAFSTQNWGRPQSEVDALMGIFVEYMLKEEERLIRNGIRLRVVGDVGRLPGRVREGIARLELATQDLSGMLLQVAVSYGGREELVHAAKRIATEAREGTLDPEALDEALFSRYLYTSEVPDPDLLIRTSGEQRVSNFLLWQIAYSEILFSEVLWPDFSEHDLLDAIRDFAGRERRFGRTSAQVSEQHPSEKQNR